MTDPIGVVNGALSLLSDRQIGGFDDGTSLSNLAKLRFPEALDAVLEAHPWNFAHHYQALVKELETPPDGTWGHQFTWPTSPFCIAPRETIPRDEAWAVGVNNLGERIIYANIETLTIGYTVRAGNTRLWSPLARSALTYYLASEFALFVTGQAEKRAQWWNAFQEVLVTATSSDSRQGYPVAVSPPQGLVSIRR